MDAFEGLERPPDSLLQASRAIAGQDSKVKTAGPLRASVLILDDWQADDMNRRDGRSATPVLVGPLSGPVHGVSVINNALAGLLRARELDFETIDLSPGFYSGMGYHLTRLRRVLVGMLHMLRRGRRRYVVSLDGGAGLFYNLLLVMVARVTGQPLILYHHSSRYVVNDSGFMRAVLAIAGQAPHIFCSRKMARLFWDRYGQERASLIINNTAWIEPAQPSFLAGQEARIRLGFMSALTGEKGLGRAIATLRRVMAMGAVAELRLAGAADEATRSKIEEMSKELDGRIIAYGVLTKDAKSRFLAELDYFLFPSLYPHETQSLVVPEALSAGLPIIAYDHRFVGELLGEAGFLVGEKEEFANKAADWILAVQGDLPERRRLARAQYEALHKDAAGQIDHLIAWCLAEGGDVEICGACGPL